MAAAAVMPGSWLIETADEDDMNDQVVLPQSPSPTMTANPPPPAYNELPFDGDQSHEGSLPSYLLFEPVVPSVSEAEPVENWSRYDPPGELIEFHDGTSTTIRSILELSIERIQARHAADVERRAASARREKPLGRAGRAATKPRRDVSMSEGLDASIFKQNAQSKRGSGASRSSGDSGYRSRSPAAHASSSTEKKFLSAISSRFKPKRTGKTPNHLVNPNKSGSGSVLPAVQALLFKPDGGDEAIAPTSPQEECVSCLEDFPTTDLVKLDCHSYCADCFQRLVNNALESETHWPVKCCLNTVPYSTIAIHLDRKTQKRYRDREVEWSTPTGERIYCSHASCGSWIHPKHIKRISSRARCTKCFRTTCTICQGSSHNGKECPRDTGLNATIDLADQEGWRRCYKCHALVEHTAGCRHITCRCNAQFCYICGLRWRTCGCDDSQLAFVRVDAELRRNTGAPREPVEPEAPVVSGFIVGIERAFEQREQDRQAAEAEARRVEEEQAENIAAISGRYHRLNMELESLHDMQHVRITERYDLEQEAMEKERETVLQTLSIRHPQERQVLAFDSQTKISDSEHTFETEYHVRLAEEQTIEHKYVDELREYWKGKPGGEYKVRAARDELRKDQEKEYKSWENYRKSRLQALAEGERKKMEALIVKQENEVRAAEGRAQIDKVEWKRKRAAEAKWVEVVISERIEMFQRLESDEYTQVI